MIKLPWIENLIRKYSSAFATGCFPHKLFHAKAVTLSQGTIPGGSTDIDIPLGIAHAGTAPGGQDEGKTERSQPTDEHADRDNDLAELRELRRQSPRQAHSGETGHRLE